MKTFNMFYFLLISGTVLSTPALSADTDFTTMPAISEFNGKFDFGGGAAGSTLLGNTAEFYGAGSLSIPIGERIGFQADFAATNAFGKTSIGGAAHLFTRDPKTFLFGAMGGYANFGNATGAWIGPEAELYLDQVSIESKAGYIHVQPNVGVATDKFYAIADLGFYATDDLRFTVGAGTVADFKTAHLGMEWMLTDIGMPVSLKANGIIGDDNFYSASAGISFYFGGQSKTLIRRHREDDPPNGVLDIFNAGGVNLGNGAPAPAPTLPSCEFYSISHSTVALKASCVPSLG